MLGIALAYYFQPGVGMNIDPKTLDAKAMSGFTSDGSPGCRRRRLEFLMKLIPTTVVEGVHDRRHPAGADRFDHVRLRRLAVRRARPSRWPISSDASATSSSR